MVNVNTVEKALNEQFVERSEEVRGLLIAALSGEHVFLLGPPGTAKSELCRAVARLLNGKYFEWLLTRFSTPEELFGPVNIEALKRGSYERVTTGKLPEAEFAFLDEIWKANSAILNALLSIMNERVFYNNSKPMRVPLRSIFAASNEVPQEDSLKAIYDRILLRFNVRPVTDAGLRSLINRVANDDILEFATVPMPHKIEMQPIDQVMLPPDLPDMFVIIRQELGNEGIFPSARRLVRSVGLIKAHALMEERDKAEERDLAVLAHVLWDDPAQERTVRKIVLKASDPAYVKCLELFEACEAAAQTVAQAKDDDKKTEIAVESATRVKRAIQEMDKYSSHPKVKPLIEQAREIQSRILYDGLGIMGA